MGAFACSKLIKSHYSGAFFCLVTCFRVTLENVFVVAQKRELWYIINEKGQPPTRWVGLQIWKKLHPFTGQSLGGFSVLELLFVVAQKRVLWYTENENGQPPTRWVARLVKMEIPPYRSAKV